MYLPMYMATLYSLWQYWTSMDASQARNRSGWLLWVYGWLRSHSEVV